MNQRTITFTSAGTRALCLEGILHLAEGDEQLPAAVICHPHPLGGGSMQNAVVVAIARALASRGVVALRFNFRGVGASQGVHDHGRGEQDDIAGAQNWLLAQPAVDPGRVSLVGYSFGACVALARAYSDPTVSAFAAVGLAVDSCDPELMRRLATADQAHSHSVPRSLTCPKLFVTGERDRLAPPGGLRRLVECLPAPRMVQIVPGVDHFWWGSEKQVGELVANFITAR